MTEARIFSHGHIMDGSSVGWLAEFDVDGSGGAGTWRVSDDRDQALVFPGVEEAFKAWQAISKVAPLRRDFRPNRPLTVLTVEIIQGGGEPHARS